MNDSFDYLRSQIPDLFTPGYKRQVQKPYLPTIIPKEAIEYWRNTTFLDNGGNTRYRDVMPFPLENPRWYFVSFHPECPFIGLKRNILDNSYLYPWIPCCFPNEMSFDPKIGTIDWDAINRTNRFERSYSYDDLKMIAKSLGMVNVETTRESLIKFIMRYRPTTV